MWLLSAIGVFFLILFLAALCVGAYIGSGYLLYRAGVDSDEALEMVPALVAGALAICIVCAALFHYPPDNPPPRPMREERCEVLQ